MCSKIKGLTALEIQIYAGSDIPETLKAENVFEAEKKYYQYDGEDHWTMKKALWNQWIQFSLQQIKTCTTYADARNAWEQAPTISFVKCMALEKMLEFTEERRKILSIFRASPEDSLIKRLAFKKSQTV